MWSDNGLLLMGFRLYTTLLMASMGTLLLKRGTHATMTHPQHGKCRVFCWCDGTLVLKGLRFGTGGLWWL